MTNYFDSPETRPQIIKREEALLPEFAPDEPLSRDGELQKIADSIKPITKKRTPTNIFVHGTSGSGKTTCVKYILRQLTEHTSSVIVVYANCWENYTALAIYNKIVTQMKLPIPRRGLARDEVFDRITQFVKNYGKPVLLVLDDLDGLREKELLFVVARSNEQGAMFGIVAIANEKDILADLDLKTRSSLRFSELEFKKYTEDQLFTILKSRAEIALQNGSYDERLLKKIASISEEGSARVALEILYKAAKHAENHNAIKITIQDLEDSIAKKEMILPDHHLCEEEHWILEILKSGPKESGEIYEKFAEKFPLTKRQIRNYLDLLENKKLISAENLDENGILKARKFSLRL